jgi:hypothetical protein
MILRKPNGSGRNSGKWSSVDKCPNSNSGQTSLALISALLPIQNNSPTVLEAASNAGVERVRLLFDAQRPWLIAKPAMSLSEIPRPGTNH